VWALRDHGFKAVVAPSFGDIFRQNCPLNGIAAIALRPADVERLFAMSAREVLHLSVDVVAGTLDAPTERFGFRLPPREQLLLTHDIDWIAATLAQRERIAAFEAARLARQPWLGNVLER
jgi:3-isopropylmalate/(R)-2-methylmalate dehydratase small subunit